MRRTGYVYDERYLLHKPGEWHPERPARLEAIQQRVETSGLLKKLVRIAPYAAPLSWVEKLHDPDYVRRFKEACQRGRSIFQVPE